MKRTSLILLALIGLLGSWQVHAQSLEPEDLDWATLKTEFNLTQNHPTIVSILSTNCPPCVAHRNDVMNTVMNQCDNPNLRYLIVWFEDPGLSHASNRTQTVNRAMDVDDTLGTNRVKQWWYKEHQSFQPKNDSVAYLWGDASWIGCNYAWDMTVLYDSGACWSGISPPPANYCMAKVGGCCNSYSISNFKAQVDLLDVCNSTAPLIPPIIPPVANWNYTEVDKLVTFTDGSTDADTWSWED